MLDLLSESCSLHPPPAGFTSGRCQALYSTELDKKLNVEEGEVRDRMMTILPNNP